MYGLVDVSSGELCWVGDAPSTLDAVNAADEKATGEAFDYMEMPASVATATQSGYLIYELADDQDWSLLGDKLDPTLVEAFGGCPCVGYFVRVEHAAAEAS